MTNANAFLVAANALIHALKPLLAFLARVFAAFEMFWELFDWLLLQALCPPLAIFAAVGFNALPILVAAYFYAHALYSWRRGVGPARAARALAEGGVAAALGVGSQALGVPYTPRALYCAAFLAAHFFVLAPHAGFFAAALLAAPPLAVIARDLLN